MNSWLPRDEINDEINSEMKSSLLLSDESTSVTDDDHVCVDVIFEKASRGS